MPDVELGALCSNQYADCESLGRGARRDRSSPLVACAPSPATQVRARRQRAAPRSPSTSTAASRHRMSPASAIVGGSVDDLAVRRPTEARPASDAVAGTRDGPLGPMKRR